MNLKLVLVLEEVVEVGRVLFRKNLDMVIWEEEEEGDEVIMDITEAGEVAGHSSPIPMEAAHLAEAEAAILKLEAVGTAAMAVAVAEVQVEITTAAKEAQVEVAVAAVLEEVPSEE